MLSEPQYRFFTPLEKAGRPGWKTALIVFGTLLAGLFLALVISVISLRWINPPFTAFTLQEDWRELGMERYSLHEHWVSDAEIPHHLKWAVIASEDQLFPDHRGFDFESIREVLKEYNNSGRVRGASTISQQVAKNLYLWPGYSYLRKSLEAGITILIELFWPKERILEVYLNIAEFGPGIFGVGKAAHQYFDIPPGRLEPDMSARLAAVLPSPKRMRVEPASPYTKERSQWILKQIAQLTGISYLPPDEIQPDSLAFPEFLMKTLAFPESLTDTLVYPVFPEDTLTYPDVHPDTLPLPRMIPDTLVFPEIPADTSALPLDTVRLTDPDTLPSNMDTPNIPE